MGKHEKEITMIEIENSSWKEAIERKRQGKKERKNIMWKEKDHVEASKSRIERNKISSTANA